MICYTSFSHIENFIYLSYISNIIKAFVYFYLQGMFLPTMPQDDLEEVKEAFLAARQGRGENPVFYRMFEHLLYTIHGLLQPLFF